VEYDSGYRSVQRVPVKVKKDRLTERYLYAFKVHTSQNRGGCAFANEPDSFADFMFGVFGYQSTDHYWTRVQLEYDPIHPDQTSVEMTTSHSTQSFPGIIPPADRSGGTRFLTSCEFR
jgi:hypothetical protein